MCKEQGHIHRAFLRRDYYLIQLHEGELQPSIRTTNGFRDSVIPLGVAAHCPVLCIARVAHGIRIILTYRCPRLPLTSRQRSPYSPVISGLTLANRDEGLVRYLT